MAVETFSPEATYATKGNIAYPGTTEEAQRKEDELEAEFDERHDGATIDASGAIKPAEN